MPKSLFLFVLPLFVFVFCGSLPDAIAQQRGECAVNNGNAQQNPLDPNGEGDASVQCTPDDGPSCCNDQLNNCLARYGISPLWNEQPELPDFNGCSLGCFSLFDACMADLPPIGDPIEPDPEPEPEGGGLCFEFNPAACWGYDPIFGDPIFNPNPPSLTPPPSVFPPAFEPPVFDPDPFSPITFDPPLNPQFLPEYDPDAQIPEFDVPFDWRRIIQDWETRILGIDTDIPEACAALIEYYQNPSSKKLKIYPTTLPDGKKGVMFELCIPF